MLGPTLATAPDTQDEFAPILPGPGASDYERYLRTDELLALQKTEDERAHHDELLFQTVHQASELWLKLAWTEGELATAHLRAGEFAPAIRLLRRSLGCLERVDAALDMLEHLAPWEYTRKVRPVLGHGSGFDSPGFRELRRVSPSSARPSTSCAARPGSASSSSPARPRVRGALHRRRAADRVGRAHHACGASAT